MDDRSGLSATEDCEIQDRTSDIAEPTDVVEPAENGGTDQQPGNRKVDRDISKWPDYENKVKFSLKLGYTEEQLRTVLARLGPDIRQNELLGELISLGSVDYNEHSEPDGDEEGKSTPSPEPAEGTIKQEEGEEHVASHASLEVKSSLGDAGVFQSRNTSDDPADSSSNLRPIVIDGSNVAMR